MSNNVSKDDEVKRILSSARSDDSKDPNKTKSKKDDKIDDDTVWETNTEETPDSEW